MMLRTILHGRSAFLLFLPCIASSLSLSGAAYAPLPVRSSQLCAPTIRTLLLLPIIVEWSSSAQLISIRQVLKPEEERDAMQYDGMGQAILYPLGYVVSKEEGSAFPSYLPACLASPHASLFSRLFCHIYAFPAVYTSSGPRC